MYPQHLLVINPGYRNWNASTSPAARMVVPPQSAAAPLSPSPSPSLHSPFRTHPASRHLSRPHTGSPDPIYVEYPGQRSITAAAPVPSPLSHSTYYHSPSPSAWSSAVAQETRVETRGPRDGYEGEDAASGHWMARSTSSDLVGHRRNASQEVPRPPMPAPHGPNPSPVRVYHFFRLGSSLTA